MTATMGRRVFTMPDLGEGLTEAEVLTWRVGVGDVVAVDQIVVDVETAKAAVEVPVPFAGTVVELHGEPGSVIEVGASLIAIAVPDEDYREQERGGSGNVLIGYGTSGEQVSRRRARRRTPPAAPPPGPVAQVVPRVISPIVRRLAVAHGIDLATLKPSGAGGVVLRRDVESAIADRKMVAEPDRTPAQVSGAGASDTSGAVRIPLRGMRRAIAEKLTRSRREIPDATTWVDVDATALLELKATVNRLYPEAGVGLLALLARCCVAGLRRFPELNAYVDVERDEIVQLPQVNLGFAAQTDRGLVVPVVRDAQRLTLAEIAAQLRSLTEAARNAGLAPHQLTGGTFTLNNYGVFGVDGSTPIVNHPEAALLGVGRVVDKPWVVDGQVAPRKVTQLSLTFDHRVCDGGTAGGFLRFVADCVESPSALIVHG